MKKQILMIVLTCFFLVSSAIAAKNAPDIPRVLANARFVYVTAYDLDQFDPNLLPEDNAHTPASQTYLWRMMARGGLQKGEVPLVALFEKAWEKITD